MYSKYIGIFCIPFLLIVEGISVKIKQNQTKGLLNDISY